MAFEVGETCEIIKGDFDSRTHMALTADDSELARHTGRSVIAVALSTALAAWLVASPPIGGPTPLAAATVTTDCTTPGFHTYTVPHGVSSIKVDAFGGGGGGGLNGGGGGGGAHVTSMIAVSGGQKLRVKVAFGGIASIPIVPRAGGGEMTYVADFNNASLPSVLTIAGGGGGGGSTDNQTGGFMASGSGGTAGHGNAAEGGSGTAGNIGASLGQGGQGGRGVGGLGGVGSIPVVLDGEAGLAQPAGIGGSGAPLVIGPGPLGGGGSGGDGYGGGGGGGSAQNVVGPNVDRVGGGGGAGGSTGPPGTVYRPLTNGGDGGFVPSNGGIGRVILAHAKGTQLAPACSKLPSQLKRKGKRVVLKRSCVTDAGQTVTTRITAKRRPGSRGRIAKLIRKPNGRVIVKTYGRPGQVRVIRKAKATPTYKAYKVVKKYRIR